MATTAKGAPRGALAFIPISIPRGRAASLTYFILRRLLWLIPVLFFVILVTFVLMHLAPGSPWDKAGGRPLSPSVVRNLNVKFGLDKPVWEQFLLYMWNALHFDFGLSYQYQSETVSTLLLRSWAPTFWLGTFSFLLIVPAGIGLGVIAALRQNTWVDYASLGFATLFASAPAFVVGIVLVVILSVGMSDLTQGAYFLPTGGYGLDIHLLMPVITLSVLPIAFIARLTRASTLDTLRQDFVRTAWAKGLVERLVVFKHVLKNSLIPVVTALGPAFAALVTGSVVVETVFAIPGIGRSFVIAVQARDYPLILASTLLYAIVIALANLVVDVLYVFIDPRVRMA
jgi:oligopeptide transport system permease protein